MCFSSVRSMAKHNAMLRGAVTLLSALFFATLTVTPNSYSVAALTLGALSLVALPFTWRAWKTSKDVRLLTVVLGTYFASYVVEMVFHSESFSIIDMPSRVLLAAITLCLLYQFPPKLSWITLSISLGALISGVIAIYFTYALNMRAFAAYGYMVIQIGGICAWLGTLSLIAFLHYVHEKKLKYAIICAIGSTFAILATLLSGARGAWLLTPFIMILSLWAYKHCLERKKLAVALTAIALILSLAAPQIKTRIELVFNDLALYKQNQLSTSSGARIEMWKSAILTSLDYPILGAGHDGVEKQKLKQIEKGEITRDILQFKRAHNQYLEELQTKGLVGVLALLVLFLVPLRWFYKKLRLGMALANSQLKAVSLMGCMHILMIMGFCLTQHYLNHHSGILVFSFGLAILAALAIRFEEDSVQDSKEAK